jgi:hypothetical protein
MQRRYFFQRVSAAFFAISLRRDEVSVLARAAPPAFPLRTRPDFVLDFPRRNPHDVNGVADRVGRALLALGASGH